MQRKTFSLVIDCENDAFADDEGAAEIGRILNDLGERFLMGRDGPSIRDAGKLLDLNGNAVGKWNIVDPEA